MSRWACVCFWYMFCYYFSEGTVRTQSRTVSIEIHSRYDFVPRGSRIERKLEPATPGRCEFHVGNEANLSFSEKNRNEVNVTNPSHHKRVTLCAQVTKLYVLVLFGEAKMVQGGPLEDGFGMPRGTRFRANPQHSVLIAAHCGVPTIGSPF